MRNIRYNLRPRNNTIVSNISSESNKKRTIEMITDEKKIKKIKYIDPIINIEKWKNLNTYKKIETDVEYNEYDDWISATSTANYLMHDPIIDWLDRYYDKYGYNEQPEKVVRNDTKQVTTEKFSANILFEMGNKFENEVVKELRSKYSQSIKRVCNNFNDMKNRNKVDDTIKYMKEGIPIIEQAMLVNNNNKTFGVVDILIRSDYINDIFKEQILKDKEQHVKAPKLQGEYHYIVIDIKWSQIPLAANEKNILNKDRYIAYKGQLGIYNLALGVLQNYIPNCAYILGKGWNTNKQKESLNGYNCFERLGEIDYINYDEYYIDLTSNAVEWVRNMRINGHKWSCINPEREEMYPNMCVENAKWDTIKKDISYKNKELTQFWMVGYKNRKHGHDNGIYKWDSPQCTSESLNINGKKVSFVLDKLLEINRSESIIVYPDIINNNTENWQTESELDFYLDFETLNECLVNTDINLYNSKKNTNVIYLIGVGYKEGNEFKFESFQLDKFSIENEKIILINLKNFIEEYVELYMKKYNIVDRQLIKPRFFHWAFAENNFLKIANNRHNGFLSDWLKNIQLVDLCKIFTEEPIIIKNMYKFKLKEVAGAMYDNNLIKTQWKDINSGLAAIRESSKYYREKNKNNEDNENNEKIMKNIKEYNKVDCKVIWEILEYIRKNHCKI